MNRIKNNTEVQNSINCNLFVQVSKPITLSRGDTGCLAEVSEEMLTSKLSVYKASAESYDVRSGSILI